MLIGAEGNSINPRTNAFPVGGSIATDLPCAGCRYNLRGLRPEGRCPECGLEIGQSIDRPPPLGQWPESALGNLIFALVLALVAVVINVAAAMVGPNNTRALPHYRPVVYALIVSWALGWYAIWRLSRSTVSEDSWAGRWGLRIAATLYVLTPATGALRISVLWPAAVSVVLILLLVNRFQWICRLAGRKSRPWPYLFVLPAWGVVWLLPSRGELDELLAPLPVMFSSHAVLVLREILDWPFNFAHIWPKLIALLLSGLHLAWVLFIADTLLLCIKAMAIARNSPHVPNTPAESGLSEQDIVERAG